MTYFIVVVLVGIIIWQKYESAKQISDLQNRLMSRDFSEYKNLTDTRVESPKPTDTKEDILIPADEIDFVNQEIKGIDNKNTEES